MTTGGRGTSGPREDEVLSRLFQQVTELQSAWFGAGYDIPVGLDRYRAWLREHTTEDQTTPDAIQAIGPMSVRADQDADRAVAALYSAHYRSLVRLVAFLVQDTGTAEEVVQDSFVAMHSAWRMLRDSDHALSYLRRSVVNRSRSVLRHRAAAGRIAPELGPDAPGTQQEPVIQPDRPTLISALRALPPRQREVLVLRYYAGLSDAQIASAMGISRGAVRSHTARAVSALGTDLRKTKEPHSSSEPESADTARHQPHELPDLSATGTQQRTTPEPERWSLIE